MASMDNLATTMIDTREVGEIREDQSPEPAVTGLPANPMMALIERVALDPRADVEKLERLLAMQERILARDAEAEFNAAMARIAKKLSDVRIVKTKSVLYDVKRDGKTQGQAEAFKYVPLDEIDKVIRPLLVEEEMDLSYTTQWRDNGGANVIARLTHKSGHYREASIPLPLDTSGGKSNVQAMGSTFSYGRRYTLCMLFNIVTMDDDDGMGGTIDAAQARAIRALIEKVKEIDPTKDETAFCRYMKAQSVENILSRDYGKAKSALEERISKERTHK